MGDRAIALLTMSGTIQWTCSCAPHPDMRRPAGMRRVPGITVANRAHVSRTDRNGAVNRLTKTEFGLALVAIALLERDVYLVQSPGVEL